MSGSSVNPASEAERIVREIVLCDRVIADQEQRRSELRTQLAGLFEGLAVTPQPKASPDTAHPSAKQPPGGSPKMRVKAVVDSQPGVFYTAGPVQELLPDLTIKTVQHWLTKLSKDNEIEKGGHKQGYRSLRPTPIQQPSLGFGQTTTPSAGV